MNPFLIGPEPPDWFKCDGCTFSPDGMFGLDWREACRWHDWAYRVGTEIARREADSNFFYNLIALGCRLRWALYYWFAVRLFGWRHFQSKKI